MRAFIYSALALTTFAFWANQIEPDVFQAVTESPTAIWLFLTLAFTVAAGLVRR